MSYQFRFATLLRLHRRTRDEAGADVGKANEAIRRIDEQTAALTDQRAAMLRQAELSRVGTVSVDTVLSQGRYDIQLQTEMRALRETRVQLEQELLRRQQALRAAQAEVKRFERLADHELAAHRTKSQQREQTESDEAAATRHLREQRNR